MSAVFRRRSQETLEVSSSWLLAEQIADVSRWLQDPANAEQVRGSTLDFGFNCRIGDEIAVQGETVPYEFLQQLVELNVTLWLSIYPPFETSQPQD